MWHKVLDACNSSEEIPMKHFDGVINEIGCNIQDQYERHTVNRYDDVFIKDNRINLSPPVRELLK
jgi:hypothetical protein